MTRSSDIVGGLYALDALAAVLDGTQAWIVGGAVRDRLLGRPTVDYDVAIAGDPAPAAKALARRADGHVFALSEAFGAWRVVARDRSWQVDLLPLAGATIEEDLAARDLTINAVAEPIGGGEHVDPFGGRADLAARQLRMVSRGAFSTDPLRTLRLARIACELGFTVDPDTAAAAIGAAPLLDGVAPERVFAELKRIVSAERAVEGVELMDSLAVTPVVLPELAQLRGVEQSRFHHLDVHDHTLAVLGQLIELERDPGALLSGHGRALADLLAEPLANELTRGEALRLGALLHDVAKPQTRSVTPEGRVTFIGHDSAGAELAIAALSRLRASERLQQHVAALTRHHLRLGFLVHDQPLTRRAIYHFLHACAPVQVDVTLLSVADRLATRGSGSEQAIARHLDLATMMIGEALRWREAPPEPPVRGDELARELGLRPGPAIGRVLSELEQASFAGEVSTREEAFARARELLGD